MEALMPILDEKVINEVKRALTKMQKPVTLRLYTQEFECGYCKDTHQLLEELVAANPLLKLEVKDFQKDGEEAAKDGIDKIPAIAVVGGQDQGVRFFGIPAGYEFSSLLNAILMVSTGILKLTPDTKTYLDNLKRPVHLQVFVTPTCPYCPQAVILAQAMACYSPMVRADMVEVSEFPHLGNKYAVQGVPRTVINEKWYVEGAAPEAMLLAKINEALQ
jgi:glutaredoxin-like protein